MCQNTHDLARACRFASSSRPRKNCLSLAASRRSPCRYIITLVVFLLSVAMTSGGFPESQPLRASPLGRYSRAGDINIGLYVPIFSRDEETGVCRNFNYFAGTVLLVTEAFLFSLRHNHGYLLQSESGLNASLGYTILDSCYSELQLAQNVIETRWTICSKEPGGMCLVACGCSNDQPCHDDDGHDNATQDIGNETETADILRGKVAAAFGPTTGNFMTTISPLLSALRTPHVVSPGPGLADDNILCGSGNEGCGFEHDYLFRTSASQGHLLTAIVHVLKKFSWWNIVVLTEDRPTLEQFFNEVRKHNLQNDSGICVTFSAILPADGSQIRALGAIVDGLEAQNQSQVVVMIAHVRPAKILFNYIVQSQEESGDGRRERIPRVWVATDWGKDYSIFEDKKIRLATLETFIRLWPDVPPEFQDWVWKETDEFVQHLKSQTVAEVADQTHNPWLCLNWGTALNCSDLCRGRFNDVCRVHDLGKNQSCQLVTGQCKPTKTEHGLSTTKVYYTSVPHTIFAAQVLIHAFHSLWEQAQMTAENLTTMQCRQEFLRLAHSDALKTALINVQLPCRKGNRTNGTCEVFSKSAMLHEPQPVFTLMTSRPNPNIAAVEMERFGTWVMENGKVMVQLLDNHTNLLSWGKLERDSQTGFAISNCKRPCSPGMVPVPVNNSCCTKCLECKENNVTDVDGCTPCRKGLKANEDHTKCVPLPIGRSPAYHTSMVLLATLSTMLFLLNILTLITMVLKRKSVVMKAADRKLSFVILFSMMVSLVLIFMLYLSPSSRTCFISRLVLLPWILLTVAAMFVKTTRIARLWRLANRGSGTPNSWTYSTSAQIAFTVLIMIIGESLEFALLVDLGVDVEELHTETHTYRVCKPGLDELVVDLYIILLLLATCCCAFIIRKMPTIANESRNLFLASFCMTVTWMLLTPMYYLTSENRPTILSLRIIGYVFSLWAWIFLPRLYLLKDDELKLVMSRSKSLGGAYNSSMVKGRNSIVAFSTRRSSDMAGNYTDTLRLSVENQMLCLPRKMSARSDTILDYRRQFASPTKVTCFSNLGAVPSGRSVSQFSEGFGDRGPRLYLSAEDVNPANNDQQRHLY